MFWNDGSYYKGEWANGIEHGQGELYVPSEGVKRGVFEDNNLIEVISESPVNYHANYLPSETEQQPI